MYQGGALGLIAFLALIVTPLFVVRSVLRSDNPLRGPPALAAGASCLAFGVASALYDILSFPQAPYLFLFMAAVCVCAASVEIPAGERVQPARGATATVNGAGTALNYQRTPDGVRYPIGSSPRGLQLLDVQLPAASSVTRDGVPKRLSEKSAASPEPS